MRRTADQSLVGGAVSGSQIENLPRPILLVSGATRTIMDLLVGGGLSTAAPYHHLPHLGQLTTPRVRSPVSSYAATGLPWGADNDCFQRLDEVAYLRLLDRLEKVDRSLFLFVTVPDVVANATATLERWRTWYSHVERRDLPAAFVAQDGLQLDQVPWDSLSCLFVGGSTEYKLGPEAAQVVREAKRRGKWVHVGRLNTWPRLRYFEQLEIDSFDGTQFSRFPGKYIRPWLERLRYRQEGMGLH